MTATATEQRIRGIGMSDESVRAILAGRKTQTRRVMKPQPTVLTLPELSADFMGTFTVAGRTWRSAYRPGDLLYVREAWRIEATGSLLEGDRYWSGYEVEYRAGGRELLEYEGPLDADPYCATYDRGGAGWRPWIHMPRWAARIWLRVTDVRVERVQDITVDDIAAEGLYRVCHSTDDEWDAMDNRARFAAAWDRLNAKRGYSWESNPFVFVYEFERTPTPEVSRDG